MGGDVLEMSDSQPDLNRWIDEHMTADPPNVLWDHKERASKFVGVARDGSVRVVDGTSAAGRKILAYFVGAQYAASRGLRTDGSVQNHELVEKLGIPDGTVKPRVKEFRDSRMIEVVEEGRHILPLANLRRALDELEKTTG